MKQYKELSEKEMKQVFGGSNDKFWKKIGEAASFYWEYTLN